MIRHLVLLYPWAFRRRYGPEIAGLLEASEQPAGDALNVMVHAVKLHWEALVIIWIHHAINAALAASLVLLGYAINDLRDGIIEIHRHWWSTLAVILVVTAAGARFTVRYVQHRTTAPNGGRAGRPAAP